MNSTRMITTLHGTVLALVAVMCCGCGDSGRPPLAGASGTVTFEGEPLHGATVVFAPESGQRVATGKTDVDGRFTLGTFGHEDGAIIDEHAVSVVARDTVIGEGKGGSSMPGGPTAPPPPKPVIPEKYFASETSGLSAEVTEDGENYFKFDLVKGEPKSANQ